MKKQVQKMAWLAIFIIASSFTSMYAQTAKATWELTATSTTQGSGTGTISVPPQTLSRLAINGYTAAADNGPITGEMGQRLRHSFNSSTAWPQGSAYDPNRYAEYALTVTSGSFNSVNVSVPIRAVSSNNLRADIFYSTNGFATSTQLNTSGALVLLQNSPAWVTYTYNFNLLVPSGTTFSLRVFPWYTSSDLSTSRYVSMQNVEITLSTAVVPLKLSSFNASLVENKAKLSWATTNEINVQGFSIEKATDGKTFSSIATVSAKNETANSYSFTDEKVVSGKTYYRLKMLDKDGSSNYSQVLSVAGKSLTQLSVYPNPVTNTIVLGHPKASANAAIKIIGMDGRIANLFKLSEAATQSSFDVSEFIKGTYIVQYVDGENISTTKFSKQ